MPTRIRNFLRRPAGEGWIIVEATARLTLHRLILLIIGHRGKTRLFGTAITIPEAERQGNALQFDAIQLQSAQMTRRAISRATLLLRMRDSCLAEALAGRQMLRRRGVPSTLYIGVEKDRTVNNATTHAWLDAGSIPVTGYPDRYRFTAFAAFPEPLPKDPGL